MVSLCSAHQAASNDIHVDLEVTLRSCDMRSPADLDLVRSYTDFDAHQSENLDGTVMFPLALVQKLLSKNPSSSSATVLTFCPCAFLPDLKMTFVKMVNIVLLYRMPFYRLLRLPCFVFEISRGGGISGPLPLVRSWA